MEKAIYYTHFMAVVLFMMLYLVKTVLLYVMGAADLSVTLLGQTAIISTIKNGKGTMVGYEDVLSEAQIEAVAEYVQGLRK